MFHLLCTVFYLWCTIKLAWSNTCHLQLSVHVFGYNFGKSGMYRTNVPMMFTCKYISTDDTIMFKLMQGSGASIEEVYTSHSFSRKLNPSMNSSSRHQAIFYEMMSERLEGMGSSNEMFCQCKNDKSPVVNIPHRSCEKGLCGQPGTPEYSVCYGTTTKLLVSAFGDDIWDIMEDQMWNKQSSKHDYYCTDCGNNCKTTVNSIPLTKGRLMTLFTGINEGGLPVATTNNDKCSYANYMATQDNSLTVPPSTATHPCVNETAHRGAGCFWPVYCGKNSYQGGRTYTITGTPCQHWDPTVLIDGEQFGGAFRKTYGLGRINQCRFVLLSCAVLKDFDDNFWAKPEVGVKPVDYWNPFPLSLEVLDHGKYRSYEIYVGAVYYVNKKFTLIPNDRDCPSGAYEAPDMKCYLYSWKKPANGTLEAEENVKPIPSVTLLSAECINRWDVLVSEIPNDKINMIGCIYWLRRHRWETRPESVVPKVSEYKIEFYVVNLEGAIRPTYDLTSPGKPIVDCVVDDDALNTVDLVTHPSCTILNLTTEAVCECRLSACTPMKVITLVKISVPLNSDMTLPTTTPETTTHRETRYPGLPPKPSPPDDADMPGSAETEGFPGWAIALIVLLVLLLFLGIGSVVYLISNAKTSGGDGDDSVSAKEDDVVLKNLMSI